MRPLQLLAPLAAIAILAGCSTEPAPTDHVPLAPPPGLRSDITLTTPTPEPAGPKVVTLGQSIDLPCSSVDLSTCMTVTFSDARVGEPCSLYQELKNDQAIALDIEVSMPATADPSFTSPFRSFPWATFSSADQYTKVRPEFCNQDTSNLDLMAEFPGGNARGTVYLDAPADVRAVVFEPNRGQTYLINTAP